ncbi:MAG: ACT domain-containing protein [Acidobacteria bacterium]|nr:ACT domain-containing protein [Acidobacteriota bacterium]
MKENISEILARAKVEVSPETYNVISLSSENWMRLLENPELSPRMTTPFMIFKDRWEVTLVFDAEDFETIKHAVRDAKIERNFRFLSFNVELDFDVVGFMAKIAGIFAASGISILPISSFSRDHVLIRQHDLADGLKALRGHVDEIC